MYFETFFRCSNYIVNYFKINFIMIFKIMIIANYLTDIFNYSVNAKHKIYNFNFFIDIIIMVEIIIIIIITLQILEVD